MAKSGNQIKDSPKERELPVQTGRVGELSGIPAVEVGAILGEGREAIIVHNGEAYRLRVTANNKLILTK
jgi:hemin uptake protein HemP